MSDIMNIDFSQPYGKVLAANPAKQKVFFMQNGIEYDAAGKACNPKQVQAYAKSKAEEAQAAAADAQKIADDAKAAADAMTKSARTAGK